LAAKHFARINPQKKASYAIRKKAHPTVIAYFGAGRSIRLNMTYRARFGLRFHSASRSPCAIAAI